MNERPFVHNGITLLSGIEPVRRAEKAADAVSVKDRTLFFCPSPLYGYGLSRLLERIEKEEPSCAVLCIEADPELYELAKKNILPPLIEDKKFCLTNICEIEKLYTLINSKWGSRAFRRVELLKFTGGFRLFPEIYDSLCGALRREFATEWSNVLTLTKLGRLYIRNTLRNIPLASRFSSLADLSFDDAPVLVLGAGPSLDDVLDRLSSEPLITEERKFKIICVDTCLGALKDRGIVPDLVVILESQHWNLRDFIGVKGWNICAAVDLSSLPASAKILAGNAYLFFTPWTQLRIFERLKQAGLLPAVISPLGSVGLTAVEIARRLTRGKIICAGLDFSFTVDKYHARGTPGHREKLNLQTRLSRLFNRAAFKESSITEVSKSGQNVRSNPIMKNYRNLFEQEFSGDERVYDIEGTGLPLGVKTLSIEKLKEELRKENNHGGHRGHGEDNKKKPDREVCEKTEGFIRGKKEKINSFFEGERERLEELRGILTGEAAADRERLGVLIDECDYLWAHFPDYAGLRTTDSDASHAWQPDLTDISFLNRVRMEIDIMLKLV